MDKSSGWMLQVADSSTKEALRWLCHKLRGFIAWSNDLKQYSATDFGKATMASSLSPEQALLVKQVGLKRLFYMFNPATSNYHLYAAAA